MRADAVEEREIDFLIDGWWACRFPFFLHGDGDVGKGLLACSMVASVTSGKAWINGDSPSKQGRVVYISGEDSASELRKRLSVAGADLEKVSMIFGQGAGGTFGLKTHAAVLRKTIQELGDVVAIVVDNLTTLSHGVNLNKSDEFIEMFSPYAAMTDELDIGLMVIAHENKQAEVKSAVGAIAGSYAIGSSARNGATIIELPFPRNGDRVLVPTKGNYWARPRALEFRVAVENKRARVEFVAFSEITRDQLTQIRARPSGGTDGGRKVGHNRLAAAKYLGNAIAEGRPRRRSELTEEFLEQVVSEVGLAVSDLDETDKRRHVVNVNQWLNRAINDLGLVSRPYDPSTGLPTADKGNPHWVHRADTTPPPDEVKGSLAASSPKKSKRGKRTAA